MSSSSVWPTCTEEIHDWYDGKPRHAMCTRRASEPCMRCEKPLCREHATAFKGNSTTKFYGTETLYFCPDCLMVMVNTSRGMAEL